MEKKVSGRKDLTQLKNKQGSKKLTIPKGCNYYSNVLKRTKNPDGVIFILTIKILYYNVIPSGFNGY
jgi:hypothetical protein